MVAPVPILIVGPSGVGKNAIIDRIVPMFAELEYYKTTTSRPRRSPSEDKYHFVDEAEFRRLIAAGEMLEWAENHGQLYGAQRRHVQAILDASKYPVPMSAVDPVKGVPVYVTLFPGTLAIFIRYNSLDELESRLRRTRPDTTDEEIAIRRRTAEQEMTVLDQYEHVVINQEGKLAEAVESVAHIIERKLGLRRVATSGSVAPNQERSFDRAQGKGEDR